MLEKKFLLEIGLTDEKEENILEYILKSVEKPTEKYYIVTPNPEILVFAKKHKDFKTILNEARVALIDGAGIVWAGKVLGKDIGHRIGGTDFMEKLCKAVSSYNLASKKNPITVGFLGAGSGVAKRTAECLGKKYIGLKVSFVGSEPDKLLKEPKSLKVDILFVAFGFPKQEIWMAENLNKIPVKVAMGVGGAFDYISESVPRAPVFIRKAGFEWLYRLIRQPWRWKRQLALIEFGWLVLKEKFS